MAWIRTVLQGEAEGRLAPIYDAAMQRGGRVYGIVRLMSIQPEILQTSMALYQSCTTHLRSPLSRWFRELVAVTVSKLNNCFY